MVVHTQLPICGIKCKLFLKLGNCRRAKCEPAVVFLVGWSAALKKLCTKVLAKSVHILGMPVLYQLMCTESSREGPGVEFKFNSM